MALERIEKRNFIKTLYPDDGPLRRELYKKHMEFFEAGKKYRERCFMSANRIGKTLGAGGYEVTLHLTGNYPDWWRGKTFESPIRCWAAGKTYKTTRDIIQDKLFGSVTYENRKKTVEGTGLIPGDAIADLTWQSGVSNLIDTAKIKHVSGGYSLIGLKAYEQGRGAFEGTEQNVIWLDEEPGEDVYGECLIRTMTVSGIVITTFTPLEGLTEVALSFLPGDTITKLKNAA